MNNENNNTLLLKQLLRYDTHLIEIDTGYQPVSAIVYHERLADAVQLGLLRVLAVAAEAVAFAGGRRAVRVVLLRPVLDRSLEIQSTGQLVQSVRRSDVHSAPVPVHDDAVQSSGIVGIRKELVDRPASGRDADENREGK